MSEPADFDAPLLRITTRARTTTFTIESAGVDDDGLPAYVLTRPRRPAFVLHRWPGAPTVRQAVLHDSLSVQGFTGYHFGARPEKEKRILSDHHGTVPMHLLEGWLCDGWVHANLGPVCKPYLRAHCSVSDLRWLLRRHAAAAMNALEVLLERVPIETLETWDWTRAHPVVRWQVRQYIAQSIELL